MKKTIIAIFVLLSAIGASAQSLLWDSTDPDKAVTVGARFGWNFASMAGKGSSYYDGRKGVAFGAAVDVNLIKSFSINTGLYFTMKGASINEVETQVGDMLGMKAKATNAVNFLELPVYASYHLRFTSDSDLQIFFGPYFGYGVYGKSVVKMRDTDGYAQEKVKLFSKSQGYHRWQSGIGLGASYTFDNHYVVGLQYQWGIRDVAELMDNQWNLFQLSVGYNF
ncbi:MAG: PorT family protein [Duncaniella sp.]|nr:PorT family protein [Duncaniella sp.]